MLSTNILTKGLILAAWLGLVAVGLAQTPIITEFMASNDQVLLAGRGESSDWIEIHNPHEIAIALGGYLLRDDDTDWPFPEVSLGAEEFLVIFASGAGENDPEGSLHTSFGLAKDGESIALVNPIGEIVSSFMDVPPQRTDISYGLDADGEVAFFTSPTPGEPNQSGVLGFVADTKFSVNRGFYEDAFDLEITTETEGAMIVYTIDGRDPHNGTLFDPVSNYTEPFTIDKTTTIRAFAKKAGFVETNTDTQTYIFTKSVVRQTNEPEGAPQSWGEFTGTNGSVRGRPVPADYEMNPAIVNDDPEEMEAALKSLPTLSIVMDPADLFGRNGIMSNPFGGVNGSGIHTMDPFVKDRQTSMEWLDPHTGTTMQIDCGIRLSGGWSRHYAATPKKSFSLLFKEQFGPSKLNFPIFPDSPVQEFDRIILKAIFSNAWPDAARPPEYLRDHFTRQTRLDMGEPASHGSWVHLYLNGLYWGIYNPTERPDAAYAASHFGGNKDEYDAVKHAGLSGPGGATNDRHEVIDGTADKWIAALELARDGLENAENYDAFKQLVDVKNLADYAVLNIYSANVDWPHKNWYANTKREGSPGYRFYSWDSEYAWHDVSANRITVSNRNTPAELYARVRRNKDFQRLFGDRVQKHLFGNGALTEEANVARYTRMAEVIEPAIVAEAARWGDHGNTRQGATNYTKARWESARDGVINNFLTRRHEVALEQFIEADLFPDLQAPVLNRYGGEVENDFVLTMRSKDTRNLLKPKGGDIFYTTDGSDPRMADNSLSASAIKVDSSVTLDGSVNIRARLRVPNLFSGGEWSALTEAGFIVGAVAADSSSFVISKIHYRPAVPSATEIEAGHTSRSDFEYLEFYNRSDTTIHLSGVRLTSGVGYRFAEGQELAQGARLLIVRDQEAFWHRFGSALPIAGEYEGRLSDGGERIVVTGVDGEVLLEIRYDDKAPWPEEADGDGSALVIREGEVSDSDPARWISAMNGGSPGAEPEIKESGTLQAWMAERGITELSSQDLRTFAFALDLIGARNLPILEVAPFDSTRHALVYRRRSDVNGARFSLEASSGLQAWRAVEVTIEEEKDEGDGTTRVQWRSDAIPNERRQYYRLVVEVEQNP